MNLSAVILAGGQSRRMGVNKAFLPVAGRPLLLRQVEALRHSRISEILVSGRCPDGFFASGIRWVPDHFEGAGPLSGIHAALESASHRCLLVLAVDMACISSAFIGHISGMAQDHQGVVPRLRDGGGGIEPLAAIYPKSARVLAASRLQAGQRSARDFASACVEAGMARFLDVPDSWAGLLRSFNTPAEWLDYASKGLAPKHLKAATCV